MKNLLIGLLCVTVFFGCNAPKVKDANSSNSTSELNTQVCIYGGTSSAVIAAYALKKQGKEPIIICPEKHIGGMTTGVLSNTDIVNKYAVTGLSRKFYRDLGKHYGKFEEWLFEPHVAEELFLSYLKEVDAKILYQWRLKDVIKEGAKIESILIENALDTTETMQVSATVFMDCTYEGDLFGHKNAEISYFYGREANSQFNENFNGVFVHPNRHQFKAPIDPYVVAGDSTSGSLWGISSEPVGEPGSADTKMQAYNFRLCLTRDSANKVPFTKPDNYDPSQYELLRRLIINREKAGWNMQNNIIYTYSAALQGKKFDTNAKGPFSTDCIGCNHNYITSSYEDRAKIWKEHEDYIKGFLYFMSHDPEIPERTKEDFLSFGWAKDEFIDNDNFPYQLYVREGRRLNGEYVMTEHNCTGKEVAEDGIALAAYKMDSHACDRHVINGTVKNEGNVEESRGTGPYPVSYRSLTPKREECTNLLVPVSLSATHVAFGSIRMEPVFMAMGQAAAIAANIAIDNQSSVQEVDIKSIEASLKDDPYLNGGVKDYLVDDFTADLDLKGQNEKITKCKECYGQSFTLMIKKALATFKPNIERKGKYKVYYYMAGAERAKMKYNKDFEMTETFKINIKHAEGSLRKEVSFSENRDEWVNLGIYTFDPENEDQYIRLVNDNMDFTTADAVLFVPEEL